MPSSIKQVILDSTFLLGICTLGITACHTNTERISGKPYQKAPFALNEVAFIPLPEEIKNDSGSFVLSDNTILKAYGHEDFKNIGQYLINEIESKRKLRLNRKTGTGAAISNTIELRLSETGLFKSPEAYQLKLTKDHIQITASTPQGIFWGVQTLLQIIPEPEGKEHKSKTILLPLGIINDTPVFEWRGAMLDVARHFFTVEEVKQYIRMLAVYKLNRLHLHLTDDQGWRIMIDAYPKLAEEGGRSQVGGGKGGYYTKEEYKELAAFAAAHYMTLIPEIDMPGHTNAASLAYPFLNGTEEEISPYTGTKVGFSTFATQKDTVYGFINKVIAELAEITPGPYLHIGGDESHVTAKEDYLYFVQRVEKIVKKHGKQMIGWDEIAQVANDTTTIAQFWNGESNAAIAARKGMKVILSPGKKAYLDMKYNTNSQYGLTWAGYIPVDTAYIWYPKTYTGIPLKKILGIEAPLWSETISNIDELEYLAFPRIIGYAELGWTKAKLRNWNNYRSRLAKHARFLNRKKVNFYRSPLINWKD